MTREVVTVAPEAALATALDEMRDSNVRHLPVTDGGRLVGIVTDRDLRLALDPEGRASETTVGEVMTRSPLTVGPDVPVESAAALLAEHRIGCLPVLEEGELVGILTESDLLRAFVDLMVGREPHTRIELLAPDRPGELARVVRVIGVELGINITGVVVPPTQGDRTLVVLHVEADPVDELLERLRQLGYESGTPALGSRPA